MSVRGEIAEAYALFVSSELRQPIWIELTEHHIGELRRSGDISAGKVFGLQVRLADGEFSSIKIGA